MSLKLILAFPVAAAIACCAINFTAAQSDSETFQTKANFAQVFADVEAATAIFDPDTASAVRQKLCSAALKRINEEWSGAVEAEKMRRPATPPTDSE